MKIKIFRFSGYPVNPDNKQKLLVERRHAWDRIKEKCGKDMLRMQKLGDRVERYLGKQYPTVEDIEFANTVDKVKEMYEEYGNIMMTTNAETGEVVYCILDAQESAYV